MTKLEGVGEFDIRASVNHKINVTLGILSRKYPDLLLAVIGPETELQGPPQWAACQAAFLLHLTIPQMLAHGRMIQASEKLTKTLARLYELRVLADHELMLVSNDFVRQ